MQQVEWDNLYLYAKNLAEENKSFEEIEKILLQKTNNEIIVSEIISRLKKIQHAIKSKNGLIKLGVAGFFLLSGFLITCINFHSNQSFTIVMYSFTSIGLILMLWGLYEIIG